MIIGINASSALKENPTGVEEYTFQLIKHLAMIPEAKEHRFVLYLNPMLKSERLRELERLPDNFTLKFLGFPRTYSKLRFLWTQGRLAWEMIGEEIDVLFIPVHVLPFIHPKKTVVTIHGLEYEFFPRLYSFISRHYIRFVTKYSLKASAKVISISESTKRDLVKLYGGNPDKIAVVHHGVGANYESRTMNQEEKQGDHILYLGRLELKKNLLGIVAAYDELRKRNSRILNKLVLVGAEDFGFDKIKKAIDTSSFRKDIIIKGYVPEKEKNDLLKNAAVFIFPSFYEGFGMPVLEAQSAGVPVVASNNSCLPEVAGDGAILVNPSDPQEISQAIKTILSDDLKRRDLIEKGYGNVERFSWEKCARETLRVLIS